MGSVRGYKCGFRVDVLGRGGGHGREYPAKEPKPSQQSQYDANKCQIPRALRPVLTRPAPYRKPIREECLNIRRIQRKMVRWEETRMFGLSNSIVLLKKPCMRHHSLFCQCTLFGPVDPTRL